MAIIEVFPALVAAQTNGLPSKGKFDIVQGNEIKGPESENSGQHTKSLDSSGESNRLRSLDTPSLADPPNLYKRSSDGVSERFIKFIPGESAAWLLQNHPNAFLLLCLIAQRARRYNGHIDGLTIGMAHIGDYEMAGIETEKKYRTAKDVLVRVGAIKILETARKRKKRATNEATKRATTGTLVLLLKSDIWDINSEDKGDQKGDQKGDRRATEGRPKGDEQEELSISSINSTMSPSQAQSTKVKERIFFDWEKMKLEGIEESDLKRWAEAFPHVDVPEYLKFIQEDIGSKPTKYKRRSQIVRTVITYFKNQNENQARRKENQNKNPQGAQSAQKPSKHNNPAFAPTDVRPLAFNNKLSFKDKT